MQDREFRVGDAVWQRRNWSKEGGVRGPALGILVDEYGEMPGKIVEDEFLAVRMGTSSLPFSRGDLALPLVRVGDAVLVSADGRSDEVVSIRGGEATLTRSRTALLTDLTLVPRVGDVVRLASGGPELIVMDFQAISLPRLGWFEGAEIRETRLPLPTLFLLRRRRKEEDPAETGEDPIAIGDVVRAKVTGSPRMTVTDVPPSGWFGCTWMTPSGALRSANLPAACLARIERPS